MPAGIVFSSRLAGPGPRASTHPLNVRFVGPQSPVSDPCPSPAGTACTASLADEVHATLKIRRCRACAVIPEHCATAQSAPVQSRRQQSKIRIHLPATSPWAVDSWYGRATHSVAGALGYRDFACTLRTRHVPSHRNTRWLTDRWTARMTERPTKRRGPWAVAAVLPLLPVLYVLSHGPWWFISAHHKPPPVICRIVDGFYSPIWRLYYADMIPENIFDTFMDYNAWWVSLGGDVPSTIKPILSINDP